MVNIIEETLLQHIKERETIFVFPTQTAANMWAEHLITKGPVKSVAMERFVAWDDFKGNSIKSKHQNKRSIPSTMRKIFAANIICQNAEKPFLKSLIVPEYAANAEGFTEWLSGLLPGLSMWKNRFTASGMLPDQEDSDLLELHRRYSEFLSENSLFDPAWETPPFEADNHHYYIFFPEILSDYMEYKEILTSSPADITVINIPEEVLKEQSGTVNFFSNSRMEIKSIALYLRKIHQEQKIPWTQMAVSVPDMDTYGPYIERELELFQIPYVSRYAKPLGSNAAGSFFSRLKNCVAQNFSYDSVKALVLNDSLPWKSKDVIQQLIEFGKNNNCITSYFYNNKQIDVWEESFKEYTTEERAANFYRDLKYKGTALVNSRSFEELKKLYFEFRGIFFDMEKCSEKTDQILGRCISELSTLIDLERSFNLNQPQGKLKLKDCYSFFVNILENQNYLSQTKDSGVMIVPYKLTCAAPYSVQVIADSSQTGLSVIYKELSFLREDKRKKLFGNQEDPNATELFIKLYQMNALSGNCYFCSASKTFDGYAQATSYLALKDYSKNDEECELLKEDVFAQEKAWFTQRRDHFPENISKVSLEGFNFWKECQRSTVSEEVSSAQEMAGGLVEKAFPEKIRISATSLKNFFACPREWYFNNFCKLEEQNNEAELFDHCTIGNLYHKFYEFFCNSLKEHKLPIHTSENGMEENYVELFNKSLELTMKYADLTFLARELLKTTSQRFAEELKDSVESFMKLFEGCVVEETETSYNFNPEEKDYTCTGRIDCLLRDVQDGQLILVDFKSFDSAIPSNLYKKSEIPNETPLEEQELPDFQMPMYIHLLKNQPSPKIVENCCFFQVSKGYCKQVFGENIFSRIKAQTPTSKLKPVLEEEYLPTLELFYKALDRFTLRLKEKDFSVNNISQGFETCNSCSNRAVCRRTFNISKQN